jgi:hypothetical protein
MCGEQSSLFTFRQLENSNLPEVHRKYTDSSSTIELWSKWLQIYDPHQISGGTDVFQMKSITWPNKNFSELISPSIFAIFDDFRVFWMETWTLPHFSRGSRKSSFFLHQLNVYLAMSTFRNRKYRTAQIFSHLKNELCFPTNKYQ